MSKPEAESRSAEEPLTFRVYRNGVRQIMKQRFSRNGRPKCICCKQFLPTSRGDSFFHSDKCAMKFAVMVAEGGLVEQPEEVKAWDAARRLVKR